MNAVASRDGHHARAGARYAALCLIMPVIEAQCASILVPHQRKRNVVKGVWDSFLSFVSGL